MHDEPGAMSGNITERERPASGNRTRVRNVLGLTAFLMACAGVSIIGAAITSTSVGNWYQALEKPSFNPPDWLFPPVWTSLYVLIAVAGWRVWRYAGSTRVRPALTIYVAQLALNIAWSFLFFGLQQVGLALAEIIVLLVAIVANLILFWRLDRWAGTLLIPYLLWVAFAAVLTASIWRLNAG